MVSSPLTYAEGLNILYRQLHTKWECPLETPIEEWNYDTSSEWADDEYKELWPTPP